MSRLTLRPEYDPCRGNSGEEELKGATTQPPLLPLRNSLPRRLILTTVYLSVSPSTPASSLSILACLAPLGSAASMWLFRRPHGCQGHRAPPVCQMLLPSPPLWCPMVNPHSHRGPPCPQGYCRDRACSQGSPEWMSVSRLHTSTHVQRQARVPRPLPLGPEISQPPLTVLSLTLPLGTPGQRWVAGALAEQDPGEPHRAAQQATCVERRQRLLHPQLPRPSHTSLSQELPDCPRR